MKSIDIVNNKLLFSSSMCWYLERQLTGDSPCYIPLDSFPFHIGRNENCQLRLPFQYISRNHAMFVKNSERSLCLLDIGSRNGTFVNGKKVKERTLVKSGDIIHFDPLKNHPFHLLCQDPEDSIIEKVQFSRKFNRNEKYIDGKEFNFLQNTLLFIEIEKKGFIETELLDQNKGLMLITTIPSFMSHSPIMGDKCRARFLLGSNIFEFETCVIRVELHPFPRLYLIYPEMISAFPYRRYRRHRTKLKAQVCQQPDYHPLEGTIIDISSGGCKIVFPSERIPDSSGKLLLTIDDIVRDISISKKYDLRNKMGFYAGFEFIE
jgi:hypothetical protein